MNFDPTTEEGVAMLKKMAARRDAIRDECGERWKELEAPLARHAESLVSSRGIPGDCRCCETGDPYVCFALEGSPGEEERLGDAFRRWIQAYVDYYAGLCFEGEMPPQLREGTALRIYWRREPSFDVWVGEDEKEHVTLRCRVIIGRQP